MLSSTSLVAGAVPRSAGLNKGLLTDASAQGESPEEKGVGENRCLLNTLFSYDCRQVDSFRSGVLGEM